MNMETAMTQFNKGTQFLEEGLLEEAIASFHMAIELDPNQSWAYYYLGEALARHGKLEEAVTAYRHAIELNPDFSWSYHHLGDALDRQEQWEEAVVAFRRAIELNAEHFGTYCGLGHSLAKLGQLDEAIAAYRRASELNPETDWIQYKLGELLQQRTQLDLEGAISAYRRALQLNPNDVEACRNLLELQPHNSDNLEESQAFRINPHQLTLISGQLLQTGGSWQLVSREGNQGQVSYGPYITLPDGLYRVIIDYEFPDLTSEQKRENSEIIGFKLDVAMDKSLVVYQENIYTNQQKPEFFIDLVNVKDLEVRFWATGKLFAVNFIEFTLVYQPEGPKAIDYYLKLGNSIKKTNIVRAIYSFQQALKIQKSITASKNKENMENFPQSVVRQPHIYDCFPFFNEIDLLKIRIEELKDVVDKFILVEATKTHSGQPKPLYYKEFIDEFAEYQDKIIHYIVDDMPEVQNNDRWPLENYQRDCIGLALIELQCQDEDIILVSDADELPRKDKINEAIQLLSNNDFVIFTHDLYAHNLDNLQSEWWCGTVACKYKTFNQRTATQVRRSDKGNWASDSKAGYINESRNFGHPYIVKGGWSFTWFGTPISNRYKLQSFAHAEVDDSDARGLEKLKYDICRPTGEMESSGEFYFDVRDIEGKDVPEFLRNNILKYRHFLQPRQTALMTKIGGDLKQVDPQVNLLKNETIKVKDQLEKVIQNLLKVCESLAERGNLEEPIAQWRQLVELYPEFTSKKCFLSNLDALAKFRINPEDYTLISGQLVQTHTGQQLVSPTGNYGQICYGPYITLPAGLYRVKLYLENSDDRENQEGSNSENVWFKFDVAVNKALVIYEEKIYNRHQTEHEFFIDVNVQNLEIRFWATGVFFAVNFIEMDLISQTDLHKDIEAYQPKPPIRKVEKVEVKDADTNYGQFIYAEWNHPLELSRNWATYSLYQLKTERWGQYILPGTIAIDIGAHSGDTTLPMALLTGSTGMVLAFEPNPYVYEILKFNQYLNRNSLNIEIVDLAIMEQEGTYEFTYSDLQCCNGGYYDLEEWKAINPNVNVIPVKGVNLAEFLQARFGQEYDSILKRVSFIKIDCEGYDKEVIKTLKPIIDVAKPALFVEWFINFNQEQSDDLFQSIHALGYSCYHPITLELHEGDVNKKIPDLLCLPNQLLETQSQSNFNFNEWRRLSDLGEESPHDFFLSSLKGISSFCITPDQLTMISGQLIDGPQGKQLVSNAGNQGQISYGPYISVPDGLYRVKIASDYPHSSLNPVENSQAVWFKFDVAIDHAYVVYEAEVNSGQKQFEFFIDFLEVKDLEIRFWAKGVPFAVNFIELTLIYQPSEDRAAADYYFELGKAFHRKRQQFRLLAAWQKALELSPEGYLEKLPWILQKASEIPPSRRGYFNFGMFLARQNQLEPALICYQKALEIINSAPSGTYSELGILLIQKGCLSEVIECLCQALNCTPSCIKYFQNFSILLLEKGSIKESVAFLKYIQPLKKQAKIYEDIWKGLNQLESVNENNPDFQDRIDPEAVADYWRKTCQYKVIDLDALTDADRQYLENIGLSLECIEFNKQDSFALEQTLIESFSDAPTDLCGQNLLHPWSYQQSLVETGYVYSVCPFSGKVLRSNQSFVINLTEHGQQRGHDLQGFIYRFVGEELYYLVTGGQHGGKYFIYLPKLDLIINFERSLSQFSIPVQSINTLKSYMVSYWQQVLQYISTEAKQVVDVIGLGFNIGHYLWQDLAGIHVLVENEIQHKLDRILTGPGDYFSSRQVFPEIPADKFVEVADVRDVFKTVLDNNYVAFRANGISIDDRLAKRVSDASLKRCSQDFLTQVEQAKTHFPLLSFQIRAASRIWRGQAEGIANIIKSLYLDFPTLGVLFDGWSLMGIEDADSPSWSMIEIEKAIMAEILTLIPSTINTYSAIGATTYETVVWNQAIDLSIITIGAGITYTSWIANKPGVVHGHSVLLDTHGSPVTTSQVRENIVPQILIPKEFVVDRPNFDYECDWKGIYSEVIKIIENLKRDR